MASDKPLSANDFPKTERLTRRSSIESLHSSGLRLSQGELVCRLQLIPESDTGDHLLSPEMPYKILITTSSRKYRKAVQRNRIKRVLRELYRLNKKNLAGLFNGKYGLISIGYRGTLPIQYQNLLPVYLKLLNKIETELEKTS
jgi:ribonuclease P protein component